MAALRIVTTSPPPYDDEREPLRGLDVEFVHVAADEAALLAAAPEADVLYPTIKVSRAVIEAAKRCRAIVLGSIGVDSVDIAAATERGIPVTNVPDTFVEEVADHTMTLLLAAWRRLLSQDRLVRDGQWRDGRPTLYQFPRLRGQVLGLIGFGNIPRAVAARARPFGVRVLAFDPYVDELTMLAHGAEAAGLDELLAVADYVSMHVPGSPETTHMFGMAEFARMKSTALFVNTGRGSTVDEAALIAALSEGRIAGAALDVLEVEPPRQDNPLLQMRNVILTAHVASASSRFDPARKRHVGRELALVLSGRWPLSCVNPASLSSSRLQRWQPTPISRGPNR
jgi:D-3-phosphoglycerate dehydrogenase / 2-oxoglutarate reductase